MKTPEQIVSWLTKQSWYMRFVENTLEFHTDDFNRKRVLTGNFNADTLKECFIYPKTKEGTDFWAAKAKEFKEWYDTTNFKEIEIGRVFTWAGRPFIKLKENVSVRFDESDLTTFFEPETLVTKCVVYYNKAIKEYEIKELHSYTE